jgi:hypothetical protein
MVWSNWWTKSLRRFYASWDDISVKLRLSRDRPLSPEDVLGRFLFNSRWIDKKNSRVKPDAFMPARADHTTSVYRTNGLSEEYIWRIGHRVGKGWSKPLLGRAELTSASVTAVGLAVTLDNSPRHHAQIHGWPPASEKHAIKNLAQELAAVASIVALR